MEYAKKMALVDPRLLETLATPKRPATLPVKAMSELDEDMKHVLERRDIGEQEKVTQYNQILRRYVTYDGKANQPVEVRITQRTAQVSNPTVAGEEPSVDRHILETVPSTMQRRAKLILDKIRQNSDMSWDSRGQLMIGEKPIKDTNITDLLNDVLRKRKRPHPTGWEAFAKGLRDANVPRELVGNKERWSYLQSPHSAHSAHSAQSGETPRVRVPSPKKRKRVVSRPRWLKL